MQKEKFHWTFINEKKKERMVDKITILAYSNITSKEIQLTSLY